MAEYDNLGREIPDPTPVAVPFEFRGQAPFEDRIKMIIRQELSRAAEEAGEESFEDADDFDVDEDPDPVSAYELTELQEEFAPDPDTPLQATPSNGSQDGLGEATHPSPAKPSGGDEAPTA